MTAYSPLSSSTNRAWLKTGEHRDLPISDLVTYPLLRQATSLWQAEFDAAGRLPARLDPLTLPRDLLPYVMLLDLEQAGQRACLRIRLAGTEVCAKHGREMKGLTTDDFFHADDADAVVTAALTVAATGQPSLARRSYITINDRVWSYVRLILPLSRDGETVDSFFKVADPASMRALSAWRTA
ncbi:PAS domain-containing protein, partial [Ferrovibrio sp.]|uniref:PAS domain-containing protein n=1 Tax=Ferrovibrio sp. TaxID=1917215 RepID=UPI0035B3B76D